MTCIVGYLDKKKKRVTMGADSVGSAGHQVVIRKDPKIFRNGDFIIGCTSSFRMIQLLRFSFKPPEVKCKDIYEYMCTDFVNAVRACFKEGGYLQKDKEGDEKGGAFLVAYKDRLFEIECDFQVGENLNGLASVGCGSDFALGSLFSTEKTNLSPKDMVLKALESAAFFSGAVGKPFIVFET